MQDELLVVERIEDGIVTIEKSNDEIIEFFNIKLSELDCDVHEGDVLVLVDGKYSVDKEKTEKLRNINVELQNIAFGD